MADFEKKVLENGLFIEDIPLELRTEKICINALKWGKNVYKTNDYKVQRDMCIRIMNSFPKQILLEGFIIGHISHFV